MNEHVRGPSEEVLYDAFISYSHRADGQRALRLQQALERIAKPWYRARSMRVFRDATDLSAAPEGWPLIERALSRSRYLVLMASTSAAKSEWVSREVSYWLEHRSTGELLVVLTAGEVAWDGERGDFDWTKTTALPRVLSKRFRHEPFWVDLRWARDHRELTLRTPEFVTAIAKLAAPVRGLDVDSLVNEAHRQHQRTMQVVFAVCVALVALAGIAFWQFQSVRDQRVLSSISRAYQALYLDPLRAVDEARQAVETKRTPEGEAALRAAVGVARSRRETRREEAQLTGSGVGYLMERWRQGDVFTKLRPDGRYLVVASERGTSGANPPGTVFLVSLDTLRTKELKPGVQARDRRVEYMGFSLSGQHVFVARQFYLDVFDLDGNLEQSVQLEFHAKPTHLIAGMFGSHLLVGDTVGHLMLADTGSQRRPQLKGGAHGDATLFVEADDEGTRAVVIFESGRADLVDLERIDSPTQHPLADASVVFAAFGRAKGSRRLLTATRTGQVQVWTAGEGPPARVGTPSDGGAPVGLATFSEDETRVVALYDDGVIRIWDVATAELIAAYTGTDP